MTDAEFSDWWAMLKRSIKPHTLIPYWSAAKGQREETFPVSVPPMSPECVVVEKGGTYQRMMWTSDFRNVLVLWDDYRRGIIARKRIDAVTHHSTYVLSIIRWLEEVQRISP